MNLLTVSEFLSSMGRNGQGNGESGAFIRLAFDPDRAAMFVNNPASDRQSKPRSIRFGREKRFKQTIDDFSGYTRARVAYGHLKIPAIGSAGADGKSPVWRHRFQRVQK